MDAEIIKMIEKAQEWQRRQGSNRKAYYLWEYIGPEPGDRFLLSDDTAPVYVPEEPREGMNLIAYIDKWGNWTPLGYLAKQCWPIVKKGD